MLRKDITKVVDQNICNSCGTCLASCGPNSIKFSVTTGGHLFPEIDYDTCTDCGLCLAVCPGDHFTNQLSVPLDSDPFIGNVINVSVGKATDKKIYQNSQSGGGITAILQYLFETEKIKAAIVTIDNASGNPYSKPKIIYGVEELLESQKSKYTPTDVNSLIPEIARIDGKIAIVGVSCHIHGLKNLSKYRKKLKDKIITIGLICDRVITHASVEFFSRLVTNEKISKFTFRDKTYTGYPGDITVKTHKGKIHVIPSKVRGQMKDFFTPSRCRLCFDKMNIYSDIVVGDPHGITDYDEKNGESLIITRTALGEQIMKDVVKNNYFTSRSASLSEAVKGQAINRKRKQWYAYYKAWNLMGRKLPEYPDKVIQNAIEPNEKDIEIAKLKLEQALSLDTYKTREDLLNAAMKYYKKQKLINGIKMPLYQIKSFIKKLIK